MYSKTTNCSIPVDEAHKAQIDAVVAEAEGKAKVRCIDSDIIIKTCAVIDKELRIPKAHMNGVVANVDYHAQRFPSSYHYIPMSTHFELQHNSKGWTLKSVCRSACHNRQTSYSVTLTDAAKAAVLNRMKLF